MQKKALLYVFVLALAIGIAIGASARYYQFTGEVIEISDTHVSVQKGDEVWTFQRDQTTDVKGKLVKGAKVTVRYIMRATSIEVK